MDLTKADSLLRAHRKKPLIDTVTGIDPIEREGITKIIPQREPFLLVDRIIGLDLADKIVAGSRNISRDEPVFRGHFPDIPLYPGVLTVEMIGQLGLCLYYFMVNETAEILPNASPVAVRATRILGSYFLEPIPPGSEVRLLAKGLENDGFFATAIGQALIGDSVCCVSVGEVCFLE